MSITVVPKPIVVSFNDDAERFLKQFDSVCGTSIACTLRNLVTEEMVATAEWVESILGEPVPHQVALPFDIYRVLGKAVGVLRAEQWDAVAAAETSEVQA